MSSECASRGQEDEGEATMVEAEAIEAQGTDQLVRPRVERPIFLKTAGAKCVRCKVNDATEFLRIALCRACFVDGVVTKFRMMLRGITRSGRVVVAYSGGKASRYARMTRFLEDGFNKTHAQDGAQALVRRDERWRGRSQYREWEETHEESLHGARGPC